jgi:hypothetical protein
VRLTVLTCFFEKARTRPSARSRRAAECLREFLTRYGMQGRGTEASCLPSRVRAVAPSRACPTAAPLRKLPLLSHTRDRERLAGCPWLQTEPVA